MFDLKRIDSKNRFEGACMENRSIRFVTSIAICPDQIVRAPVSELVDIVLQSIYLCLHIFDIYIYICTFYTQSSSIIA